MIPHIVMLRGTSGSGKTIAVRCLLDALQAPDYTFPLGPRGKVGGSVWLGARLAVFGQYGNACGGCDGVSWKGAADDMEPCAVDHWRAGRSVVLEGLTVSSWGTGRLQRMHAACGGALVLLTLTTPLDVCVEAVNARRRAAACAKGKAFAPVDPANTATKHRSVEAGAAAQARLGLNVEYVDRERAAARLRALVLGA